MQKMIDHCRDGGEMQLLKLIAYGKWKTCTFFPVLFHRNINLSLCFIYEHYKRKQLDALLLSVSADTEPIIAKE